VPAQVPVMVHRWRSRSRRRHRHHQRQATRPPPLGSSQHDWNNTDDTASVRKPSANIATKSCW